MRHFITNKRYFRHTSEVLLILGILGAGLLIYEKFKFQITYFEFYHIDSYWTYLTEKDNFYKKDVINTKDKADGIPVLLFHGVLDDDAFLKSDQSTIETNTSLSKFKEQLFALKRAGWNTVSLSDFKSFMRGELSLPQKSFLLTFDDGRKDSFYPVDPILKTLDYNAVMFVITDRSMHHTYTESSFYLSKDEINFIINSGRWEIGSHGSSEHVFITTGADGKQGAFLGNKIWLSDLNRLESDEEYYSRLVDSMGEAKELLEASYGINIDNYAYPYGDYGQRSLNFSDAEQFVKRASKEIYPYSYYQVSPNGGNELFNFSNQPSERFIRRLKVSASYSGEKLVSLLSELSPKKLPYNTKSISIQDLYGHWGDVVQEEQGAMIKSLDNNTSAFYSIAGSSLWSDYSVKASILEYSGEAISLVGYYKSEEDFYSCVYTPKYIRFQKKENGVLEILKEISLTETLPRNFDVVFGVNENNVFGCGINENIYSSEVAIDTRYQNGQTGFRIWSPILGQAFLRINQVIAEKVKLSNLIVRSDSDLEIDNFNEVNSQEERTVQEVKDIKLPFDWNSQVDEELWKSTWGTKEFLSSGIKIRASLDTTGGMMVLPGSQNWLDYKLSYKLDWIDGTNVVVVLRYQGNSNFLSINIHDDYIRVEELFNGKTRIIGESVRDFEDKGDLGNYAKDLDVVVRVYNNKISVFLNGSKKIETENPNRLPRTGLVGLKVWDKNRNEANVVLRSFIAEQL